MYTVEVGGRASGVNIVGGSGGFLMAVTVTLN